MQLAQGSEVCSMQTCACVFACACMYVCGVGGGGAGAQGAGGHLGRQQPERERTSEG